MNIIEIVLNQVTATTKTQKTASKLITKMTVEINSTGQKLVNTTSVQRKFHRNFMVSVWYIYPIFTGPGSERTTM